MQRYDSYKDSGVKWLGEIPSHWEVCKIKHHYKMFTGFTPPTGKNEYYSENQKFAWVNIGDMKNKYIDDTKSHLSELYVKTFKPQVIPEGSLLYSFKLSVGNVAFAKKQLYTNEAIASFLDGSDVCLDFLYYSAPHCIIKNANTNIYGAFILNQDLIKNAVVVFPPLEEQEAIANYLDSATSKIDEAISQQQKMIDLLNERKQIIINNAVTKGLDPNVKMKPSGIDWIGDIPEHWEVNKLKNLCKMYGRIGFRGYSAIDLVEEGEGAITLSPTNFDNGILSFEKCSYLSWAKYYESPEIMVKPGDIVFVKTASIGKVAYVEDIPLETTVNPQILVMKDIIVESKYLAFYLQSSLIQGWIFATSNGSTILTIPQTTIGVYPILLPPVDEQKTIVKSIESEFEKIDSALKLTKKQISLLQERKQIIINDVVTGKVKVI